jgi:hypothetical protein
MKELSSYSASRRRSYPHVVSHARLDAPRGHTGTTSPTHQIDALARARRFEDVQASIFGSPVPKIDRVLASAWSV